MVTQNTQTAFALSRGNEREESGERERQKTENVQNLMP